MKRFGTVVAVCGIALLGTAIAPSVRADEWNKKTVVTFSSPVEIPGVHLEGWGVLPAGSYVFKLLDSQSDRHIVQIFNKEETMNKIYAAVAAPSAPPDLEALKLAASAHLDSRFFRKELLRQQGDLAAAGEQRDNALQELGTLAA